jgi:hypothetical protein
MSDIADILANSDHLLIHAIEKAVERGKVNIVEMLIANLNLTIDNHFAQKLFNIAMKNNRVECFDLIERLCERFDLYFHPKKMHNIRAVFRYGFEKFHPEMLNWCLPKWETISDENSLVDCYPEKIENWGVLQWLKERGFSIKPNQRQVDVMCKQAFESRQIGMLFWLRRHGITLSPNAEMLLCITQMTFEPLKEIVGPDVYGVILKYFR